MKFWLSSKAVAEGRCNDIESSIMPEMRAYGKCWPFKMLLSRSITAPTLESFDKAKERLDLGLMTVLVQPSSGGEVKECRVGPWEGIWESLGRCLDADPTGPDRLVSVSFAGEPVPEDQMPYHTDLTTWGHMGIEAGATLTADIDRGRLMANDDEMSPEWNNPDSGLREFLKAAPWEPRVKWSVSSPRGACFLTPDTVAISGASKVSVYRLTADSSASNTTTREDNAATNGVCEPKLVFELSQGLNRPNGIAACHRYQRIYVANHVPGGISGIAVFDASKDRCGSGDPVYIGSMRCDGLSEPVGIAVTQDESTLVVTDADTNKVHLIDVTSMHGSERFLAALRQASPEALMLPSVPLSGEFYCPSDLSLVTDPFDGSVILAVSDRFNNRVLVYRFRGSMQEGADDTQPVTVAWGGVKRPSAAWASEHPSAVALTQNGYLFALNSSKNGRGPGQCELWGADVSRDAADHRGMQKLHEFENDLEIGGVAVTPGGGLVVVAGEREQAFHFAVGDRR